MKRVVLVGKNTKTKRVRLRQDRKPADPCVIRLFRDIQVARTELNYGADPGIEQFERKAWKYLMQYFTTLELPEGV